MDEVQVKEAPTKKPFLRRGTGLKRFYKDLDVHQNKPHFQTRISRVIPNNCPPPGHNLYDHVPISSVLKSADSPKRNLNVRFSNLAAADKPCHRRLYNSASESDDERSVDKEKCNPNGRQLGTSDEDESVEDEEWETEDEDDGASVVEINESMVEEVFKSILKSKAQRELFPVANLVNEPVTGGPGNQAQQLPSSHRLDTNAADGRQECHALPNPWNFSFPAGLTSSPNSKARERELEMFEKMERFTSNQSFCSTASTVCRFVNTELSISPQANSVLPLPPQGQGQLVTKPLVPQQPTLPPPPVQPPMFKEPPRLQSAVVPQPPIWNPAIENRKEELAHDDQYLTALLTTRILQLESEIEKHRTENKRIVQLREFLDKESDGLEHSLKEFQGRQRKEWEVIDELKRRLKVDQEKVNRELSQGRKLKSAEEETESEVKNLRIKVLELEKESKVRSSRWASSARNFKTTIEELKAENDKLQKSIVELKNDKIKLNMRLRKVGTKNGVGHFMTNPPEVPAVNVNSSTPATLDSGTVGESERESMDENGSIRLFSVDGQCLEVRYPNGDIKDLRDLDKTGARKYYFKAADSWEIIHPDGTEILEFGTGEVQTKFPNGIHETKYVSGAVRRLYPDGLEECIFPDKTLIRTGSEGEREIHLPNGQVEYHSKNIKIRIYPDGTEKVLYNNGSALTRYASGRERFRDPSGQIVYDRLQGKENTPPGNQTPLGVSP